MIPEPGERRRVRYRLHSAPVQVAQQFLAALAHDWDDRLEALKDHLDRSVPVLTTTKQQIEMKGTMAMTQH